MHGGFGLPTAREPTSQTPAHCSSAIRRYRLSFQCHVSIVPFFHSSWIFAGSFIPISPPGSSLSPAYICFRLPALWIPCRLAFMLMRFGWRATDDLCICDIPSLHTRPDRHYIACTTTSHFPLCPIDVLRLSNVELKTSENGELGRKYSNVDKVPPATSFVVTREQPSDSAGFHATLSTKPSQR